MRRYTYFFPFSARKVCVGVHSARVMEGFGFSPIDTKRRSLCASFRRVATIE
jgi:hypothetical protein